MESSTHSKQLVELWEAHLVLVPDTPDTTLTRINRSLTPTVGVEFYKAELLLRDGIHATLQASCTAARCSAGYPAGALAYPVCEKR